MNAAERTTTGQARFETSSTRARSRRGGHARQLRTGTVAFRAVLVVLLSSGGVASLCACRTASPGQGLESAACPSCLSASSSGFVLLPAGRFRMGSDAEGQGSREVLLTRDFWLKATELTQGEWKALMGTSPSRFASCGDDCPVEQVSWWDALAYLNALSASEGLEACYALSGCKGIPGDGSYVCEQVQWPNALECEGYRLPTEAEWEYAARAGGALQSVEDGQSPAALGCEDGAAAQQTQPVASKAANAWGLYDLQGNVREWVWDRSPSKLVSDPTGLVAGDERVMRGDGWNSGEQDCRLGNRGSEVAGFRSADLGLRPARSAKASPERGVESAAELLVSYVSQADERLEAGDSGSAEQFYQMAVQLYESSGLEGDPVSTRLTARAQFMLGELAFRAWDRLYLQGDLQAFKLRVQEKLKVSKGIVSSYAAVPEYGVTEWSSAAQYRIGSVFDEMGRWLAEAPCPTELSVDECAGFHEQMVEVGVEVREQSRGYYEAVVEFAKQNKLWNEWAQAASNALEALP